MNSKCEKCGADILWVITPKGERTPVDAAKTRVAMLMGERDPLKIEEVHEGHQSHLATCKVVRAGSQVESHSAAPDPASGATNTSERPTWSSPPSVD